MEITFLSKLISEFFGTMIVVLLGDGVMANTRLNKSSMKGAGSLQISLSWGMAYMIPTFIFMNASGAHFNPAISLAYLFCGYINFATCFFYIISQILGAMVGAFLVYVLFKDQLLNTQDENIRLNVFCPMPSINNMTLNLIQEIILSFILVFVFYAFQGSASFPIGIFAVVTGISMSLGGVSGFCLNPARDLGPKIIYSLIPIENKLKANWDYCLVTILGPVLGALLAVVIAQSFKYMGVIVSF